MNKKIFISIFSILIITIAIGVFFITKKTKNNTIVTKTGISQKSTQQKQFETFLKEHGEEITLEPVDTTNWQTYTDKERGFSFKYPNDWIFLEIRGESDDLYCLANPNRVQDIKDVESIKSTEALNGITLSNGKRSDVICDVIFSNSLDASYPVMSKEVFFSKVLEEDNFFNQDIVYSKKDDDILMLGNRGKYAGYYAAPFFAGNDEVLWLSVPLTNAGDNYNLIPIADNILSSVVK